jgi:SAM-dependent methyltransferase
MTVHEYVMGRTPEEYERLRAQSRMFEADTARLLDRAVIPRGARCLDVGCGPGEVMRLLAERVGAAGEVVGVDVDAELGGEAVAGLHAAGHRQCRFEAHDVEAAPAPSGAPFDLVFARMLLLHVADPVTVLRRLWDWVAPGGCLVIQDYDLRSAAVVPELPVLEEYWHVAFGVFEARDRDLRLGLRLPALQAAAGLGTPDGIDAAVALAPFPEHAPMLEAVYRSLLPAALSLGLTTRERAEDFLAEFSAIGADAHASTAMWPLLIGTYTRKPDRPDGRQ